ncbi:protein SYS1 homolog [Selaginella moellendorffii]|uniref:protein SYS1 homolog n=1 Tax=Selaginella moellendorffii TaxID=88036 RepID=UPI000D1D0037|nr:protein SYS1 homolog [Selaginella moellendorffii]|eukprot:XP_024525932.1 protein SYS1 homolog [Selaginella moellendorffii]
MVRVRHLLRPRRRRLLARGPGFFRAPSRLLVPRAHPHTMFYGAAVWDPWLIVSQIVCIQCLSYVSLGALLWAFVGVQVPRFTLHFFFDHTLLSFSSATGWCLISAFILNSLLVAAYLFVLVERAKKCLDFSATVYIIHLVLSSIYGGFPLTVTWWLLMGTCLAVTALLGEWLCLRRELRDIPIRTARATV